jgi:hypothetical protein
MKPRFFSAPMQLGDGSLVHNVMLEKDTEELLVWEAENAEQADELVGQFNAVVTRVLGTL